MGVSNEPEYSKDSLVEFRTNQIKPFKSMFESIKNNLPDTSIFFTSDGLKILQLDSALNFLVNVHLYGENFEHYYCYLQDAVDQKHIEVNLSTIHLNQVFKSVTNEDNLFRFIYEKNSDCIRIEFCSDKKSECRTYELPIQNPDEDINVGEISETQEFSYCLTMPCADLQRICRDLKTQGCERITISHDGETLKFCSNTQGNIKTTITRSGNKQDKDGMVKFIKCPEGQTYSDVFKFCTLNEFSKCQSGSDGKIVKMLLNQGDPIVLYFEIGTLGTMAVAIATNIGELTT